jgi:hypothetical protein
MDAVVQISFHLWMLSYKYCSIFPVLTPLDVCLRAVFGSVGGNSANLSSVIGTPGGGAGATIVHDSHNDSVANGRASPRQTPRGVVTGAGSYNVGTTTGAGSYNAGTGAGSYNAGTTTGAGSYNAGAREEGGDAGYPPQRSSGSDWASPAGAPGSGPQVSGGGAGGGGYRGEEWAVSQAEEGGQRGATLHASPPPAGGGVGKT